MSLKYKQMWGGPIGKTSIHEKLVAIMRETHDTLGISAIIGPYGIGKTTAIRDFVENQAEGRAISVKSPARRIPSGVSELVLCKALERKLQTLDRRPRRMNASDSHEKCREKIVQMLIMYFAPELGTQTCLWNERVIRAGDFPRITLVVDEAQELSRFAFNALRFWSDRDENPFFLPVSIVLFGNSELAEVTERSDPLRGAVDSRLLYREVFDYADISDNDMRIWLECSGLKRATLQTKIIKFYKKMNINRDGRRLRFKVEKIARSLGPDYSDEAFMNLFQGLR